MPKSEVYNTDCLDFMRSVPDGYFDLMIADAPYGDGLHAENGGGKGWFTKYNQKAEDSVYNTEHRNLRGRFDRYNDAAACSQFLNVERENKEPQYNRFGNPGSRFERYKSITCTVPADRERERES